MACITEITSFHLRESVPFNPMIVLEVLKQLCLVNINGSGQAWKAYQEKEDYQVFYIIGGWSSNSARRSHQASESHKQKMQMLSSYFATPETLLVAMDSKKILDIQDPVIIVEKLMLNSQEAWDRATEKRKMSSKVGEEGIRGGKVLENPTIAVLVMRQGSKEIDLPFKAEQTAVGSFRSDLEPSVSASQIRHLELNRFI